MRGILGFRIWVFAILSFRLLWFASAAEHAPRRSNEWQQLPFDGYAPRLDIQQLPCVAASSNGFLVVWHDWRFNQSRLFTTRVDTSGAVLDPNGIRISDWPSLAEVKAVASDGQNFLVVFAASTNFGNDTLVCGAFVRDGVASPSFVIATNGTNLAVAFSGGIYMATWSDGDIHAARIRPDGSIIDSFPVCTAPLEQSAPLVAAGDGEFLIAWRDYRDSRVGNEMDLYGRVVPANAHSEPADEFLIAQSAYLKALTRMNDRYVFLWWSGGWAGGVFLRENGQYVTFIKDDSITEQPIDLNFGRSMYDESTLAAGPDGFWVLGWGIGRPYNQWHDIYALRFDSNGVRVTSDPIQLTSSYDWQRNCAAAALGTNVFVAWQHRPFPSEVDQDIYGTLLIGEAPQKIDGVPLSLSGPRQLYPAVASNGRDYFMAWLDARSNYWTDVVGARLNRNGQFVESSRQTFAQQIVLGDIAPAVASSRGGYLIAWQDWRAINTRCINDRGQSAGQFRVPDEWPINPPVLAGSPNGYFGAWTTRSRVNRFRLATLTLSPEGESSGPVTVETSVNDDSFDLATAASSADWLLLWAPHRYRADRRLQGFLMDQRTGERRELVIAGTQDAPFVGSEPAVTWNGRNFGVAWLEYPRAGNTTYRVVAVILNDEGKIDHGPVSIETSDAAAKPIVMPHVGGFLVAWREGMVTGTLKAAVLGHNGKIIGVRRSFDVEPLPASQFAGVARSKSEFLFSIGQQNDWLDGSIIFRRFRR